MTYIETVPEEQAEGTVADVYASERGRFGLLPNFTQAFSLHPEVYAAWLALNGAIKEGMDLRRYELATVAAARRLRSSYCMLAHGTILADRFLGSDAVRAIAADPQAADLDETDLAVMDLADKVAADATAVTEADVERLRSLGMSDADILGVVLAAAARCFFSKVLDGVGALPDREYEDKLEPELREALTVGRPIANRAAN
jgi:uncharacterized peroxidase-related enzyme